MQTFASPSVKAAGPSARVWSPRSLPNRNVLSCLRFLLAFNARKLQPSVKRKQDEGGEIMREYVWLECTGCGSRNYRAQKETRGAERLELKKFCRKERKHTL